MNRWRQWCLSAVPLAGFLTLACSSARMGETVKDPGVTVSATVDRNSVGAGEELKIGVTVANATGQPRTLQFSSGCQTGFEFTDEAGRVVGVQQRMCTAALGERTLTPGQNFSETHSWIRGSIDGPALAAGTYLVRGVLLAIGDTIRSTGVRVTLP